MRRIAAVNRMLLTEAKIRDKEQSRARLREGGHAELGDLQNAIAVAVANSFVRAGLIPSG